MQFLALASDYDGTLAENGRTSPQTVAAVERLRASGRKFLLITGRELPDLMSVFPELPICDLVVAENGAVLYWPQSQRELPLAGPPPQAFLDEMQRRKVSPFSRGRSIFATRKPHDRDAAQVIDSLGLDLEVILNKDSVMVLPKGVHKASGLAAALKQIDLAPERVVGVGDAENDAAFLEVCGCSVAVSNAIEFLKARCRLVTQGARGDGVIELIDRMLTGRLP